MGGSGKWLKSLITLKKTNSDDHDKIGDKSKKKWRLWRSSSEGFGSSMKKVHGLESKSDSSFLGDDAFNTAMATVVRAPPKNFMVIKQEWAATRIQAVFRSFLARQALRALKAVVRLQAIFRGRQVRKQAAVTLRCMQALVRVQARARARTVSMSPEGQAEPINQADPINQAEQGWCDSLGTVDEVREKLQMRQEAVIKRERAMAYFLSKQKSNVSASPKSRTMKQATLSKHHRKDKKSLECNWLEDWMASKPGNRLMEEIYFDPPEVTPNSRKSEDNCLGFHTYPYEYDPINVRRNNVTTRIFAKPLITSQSTSLSSTPSSESLYVDSPASTSCTSASSSLLSSNTLMVERREIRTIHAPSYMNLTESTKAKQRPVQYSSDNVKRLWVKDSLSHSKSIGDTRSSASSDPSVNLCNDLYPPLRLGTPDRMRYRRQH
ncbi:protein IQ-DOMAIN 1-like [Quillaja saponaria]|uniref:Protein IQ-DOMAIN 1-like n=1 Tax=Quillaja saponaria TaxID=32244 RepID=A0AAD7L4Q3_QUISA|nr:protein IQ-DOMAIN 1-like [Quillaja saponaria]